MRSIFSPSTVPLLQKGQLYFLNFRSELTPMACPFRRVRIPRPVRGALRAQHRVCRRWPRPQAVLVFRTRAHLSFPPDVRGYSSSALIVHQRQPWLALTARDSVNKNVSAEVLGNNEAVGGGRFAALCHHVVADLLVLME